MRLFKLMTLGMFFLMLSSGQAQVTINVHTGAPPSWGPSGYSEVEYYYLPDVQSYYDVRNSQFIYFGNGKWIRSRDLPRRYRDYDLYNGYKVVLNDYHGDRPYTHFKDHKVRYYKGYKGHPQKSIGQRPDHRKDSYKRDNNGKKQNGNNGHNKGNKKHGKH